MGKVCFGKCGTEVVQNKDGCPERNCIPCGWNGWEDCNCGGEASPTCGDWFCDEDTKPAPKKCPPCDGWVQGKPSGCATECGILEGQLGTPGIVTCGTPPCDPNKKPDPKLCPQTKSCNDKAIPTCDVCAPLEDGTLSCCAKGASWER